MYYLLCDLFSAFPAHNDICSKLLYSYSHIVERNAQNDFASTSSVKRVAASNRSQRFKWKCIESPNESGFKIFSV